MSMAGNQAPMTKAEKIQAFLDRRRAEDLQRQYLSSGMQTDDEAAFQQRLDEAMKESLLIYQLQSPVDDNDDMAAQLQMEEVLHDSFTEAVKHKQATSLTPDQQDLVLPLSNGPEKGAVGGKTKKSKHLKKDKRKKAITGDVDGFDSSEDQGSSDGSCSSAEFEDASEEIQDVLKSRGKESGRRKKLTWRERKNLRKTSGTVGCHNVEVLQDELLNADVNPELAEVLRSQAESLRSGHSRQRAKQRDSQDQACDDNSLNNGDLLSSTDQSDYRVEIEPRLELSAFADDGFPETWNRQAPGSTDESDGDSSHIYRLFPLSPGDAEYCAIAQEFSQVSLEVQSIERLQHPFLLDKYKIERELVLKSRHSEFELNEKYLYHGTRAEKRLICEEGLDQRLSRTGHFGRGIYFSDNPRKCMHYSGKQKSSGPAQPSYILKCRVILGDTKIYPHGNSEPTLKREPLRENPVGGWKYYDSVKGGPKDFNEFVIYEGRRAITEYIITYQQSTLAPPSGGENGQQSESICPSDPVLVNTKSTLKWTKVVPGKKEDQNSAVAVDHNKTDEEKTADSAVPVTSSSNSIAEETSTSPQLTDTSPGATVLSDEGSVKSESDSDSDSDSCDSLSGAGADNSAGQGQHSDADSLSQSTTAPVSSEGKSTELTDEDETSSLRKQVALLQAEKQVLLRSQSHSSSASAVGTVGGAVDTARIIPVTVSAGDSRRTVSANQQSGQADGNAAASSQSDSATAPVDADEAHRIRLEKVREEIRRKRAEKKLAELANSGGADHMGTLGQVQQALQKKNISLGSSGATLDARASDSLRQAFADTYGNMTHLPGAASVVAPQSGGGNSDEVNLVEEVMSRLITEFVTVTNTDNINQARTYISQADMDLNQAIFNYYNDQT